MRTWIGLGLLAAVLFAGIWAADVLADAHGPAAEDLNRAAELSLAEDWDSAAAMTARAARHWQEKRTMAALFSEQEPVEAIDLAFTQLEIYEKARDRVSYSTACAGLARQLEALGRCHGFSLVNLM